MRHSLPTSPLVFDDDPIGPIIGLMVIVMVVALAAKGCEVFLG